MSVLAALLMAAQAGAAAVPAPEDTISVVAERMRSIQVNVVRDRDGTWHCNLSASSGNAWVDERLCLITTFCVRDARGDRQRSDRCIARRRAGVIDELRAAIARGEA